MLILNGIIVMFGVVVVGLLFKDELFILNKLVGVGLGLIGVGFIMGLDVFFGLNFINLV